jgi:hypothetical protein
LTVPEARTLLTINGQGHEWEAPQMVDGEKLWNRDDNATARLSQDGTTFTIKSRELTHKEAVAKRLERTPSLDGF